MKAPALHSPRPTKFEKNNVRISKREKQRQEWKVGKKKKKRGYQKNCKVNPYTAALKTQWEKSIPQARWK
jgi:hypothetical protein